MKKLLLVGAMLIAACSCAQADVRARWSLNFTPTYEDAGVKSKTTMVRLALEFISPDGKTLGNCGNTTPIISSITAGSLITTIGYLIGY